MKLPAILVLLMTTLSTSSQITQNVVGRVVDSETNASIPGVTIILVSDSADLISTTDFDGNFILEGVPVGRHNISFSFIGYNSANFSNIIVASAHETVLNVTLVERVEQMEGVEIRATRDGDPLNEMAVLSARQFSVSETDRYAGSRGDPARMASNFAGVQGADDTRNDIVVRGNSPQGVLWRVEGIDIPNPNHFNIPGTAGGPVAILNNKVLSNSDFYTGAFPAEFGNSIAGVFDLRLRNGNSRKHEFSGQFGFLGTELMAEGPIKARKNASYLANYRYSTLSLFGSMGIDIGTSAIPRYQDAFFRVFIPTSEGGTLSIWGLGGDSGIDILISDQEEPERNIFGENDRDQYFRTRMGILGITSSKAFDNDVYVKQTLAVSHDWQDSHHELVYRHLDDDNKYVVDSLVDLMNYTFRQNKVSWSFSANKKFSPGLSIKAGALVDGFQWKHFDEIQDLDSSSATYRTWDSRWDSQAGAIMLQPFVQAKWRPSDDWTIVGGFHGQYLSLNQSSSWFQPRIGIKRQLGPKQSISIGGGRHTQMQSAYLYFYQPFDDEFGRPVQYNRDMDFTMSDHVVLSYDRLLGSKMRLKLETYFQGLSQIPVEVQSSSFSLVNSGAGFARFFPDSLMNSGIGVNYGVEMTLEKFFSDQYFFMVTASIFHSEYEGSDEVRRNTDFNGGYAINALGSKEWAFNETSSLVTGLKVTVAGGRWYGPVDIDASNQLREVIYVDSLRNTLQFDDYFRLDLKINYKANRPRVTHEIGVDLVNLTNQQNVLKLSFAPDENDDPSLSVREEYQLGFLPIFFYKLDF